MASGFIVRLRPAGPWRIGPSSGARDRVDSVLHSDTLYSALTLAAGQLGILEDWLRVTASAAEPLVRVASAFPFVGRTLLAPAPKHVWPPAAPSRVRWKSARFVPLHIVPRLLAYEALKEDRWAVDPVSEAVLPVEKFGEVTPPFRVAMRRTAAVDRVTGISGEPASTACLEFSENAGMWCAVFCTSEWRDRVQSLFRFVADSGLGGERSLGWGRSAAPEFDELAGALNVEAGETPEHHETGYWLLSLFAPAPGDRVDWSRGSYGLLRRSGRTQNGGDLKPESAMVEEGSVVMAETAPIGIARDIAPAGSAHPSYRAGFAVAVPVPVRLPGFYELGRAAAEPAAAEEPSLRSEPATAEGPSLRSEPAAAEEPSLGTESAAAEEPSLPTEPETVESSTEFEAADAEPILESQLSPDTYDHVMLPASEFEPIEDETAFPAPPAHVAHFVVETEPAEEDIRPTADGGAYEDGPALPDADGDALDKQPREEDEA